MMKFRNTLLDLSNNRVIIILGCLGLALIITMLYENSLPSVQWSEIYRWRQNTDDLQTGVLVDEACLSRSLQHVYRGSEAPSYSGALLLTWNKYIAMHRSCVKDTAVNWTKILESSSSVGPCKYLVYVETGEGLGNRILSLASALVYALLTDRVLVIDSRKELCKLMCEPFNGSSWLLPSDFPYGIVEKAPDLGKAIQQKFNQTPVIHLRLAHIQSHADQLFFCDEYQQKLAEIPLLAWSSNQYFVTNFFRVPSLWRKLKVLFPIQLNIFTQLTSLALSPANDVWTLISRYYTSYLSCSNSLVGVQIRPHGRPNLAEFDNSVYQVVLNCLTTQGLIPRFSVVNEKQFSLTQLKHKVNVSVFVASLQGKYYQTFRDEFLKNVTSELANFYVLSSEGGELHSFHQASLALAEMWVLSFSNHIVTSEYSTFGYIANAAASKRPWLLKIRGNPVNVSGNICYLGQSTEPCTHFPQGFKCGNYTQEHTDWIKAHIAECQDQRWGLQLLN